MAVCPVCNGYGYALNGWLCYHKGNLSDNGFEIR